jgi:SpoVK/Ycf46/Vps4 family AAA+-type ATPase
MIMPQTELPKGIQRIAELPQPDLLELWNSIVVDEGVKSRLLSQAIVNFTVRPKVSRTVLPLHGAILLVGAPGTGKTSLAKGLANELARLMKQVKFTLLQVDPHALGSSMMGKTQKAVSDLFGQTVAEAAMKGPIIVLLDEVETLAADRSKLSLEANPVDVHRATDAVLVQLDALAEAHPNILFIATSNFPQAVDAAFTSRCDLVLEVPLPNLQACEQILTDCLMGLGKTFGGIEQLPQAHGYAAVVKEVHGLDGRAIRKVVANALTSRREVALKPQQLSLDDIRSAAKLAKAARTKEKQ